MTLNSNMLNSVNNAPLRNFVHLITCKFYEIQSTICKLRILNRAHYCNTFCCETHYITKLLSDCVVHDVSEY